jgi:surface carbohydrate biosynthesis protein
MKTKKTVLQIPVEGQIREFDAKLLLACIAAKRGFSSVIGCRQELKSRIASFPRSIYIAKDLRAGSRKIFNIMHSLGCKILAWDEEGLVHDSPEIYYETRLSSESLKYVSQLFAWGQENAELWHRYPELPSGTPIHTTGNPRGDMLRPDIRNYYEEKVQNLRQVYGNFILVNTNFVGVNAIVPVQNFFLPENKPGEGASFGRSGKGLGRNYAEGLMAHTQAIFEDFKLLIPDLEQAFPNHTIVVRPHPLENPKLYHDIAFRCKSVRVTNEGNVVPWLMAARAVIHNGCTTGAEAYVIGVPVVAYRATVNEYYDNRFFRLPNQLSLQCFDFEELRVILGRLLSGEPRAEDVDGRKALIDYHLSAQDGPLACERILDIIEKTMGDLSQLPKPPLRDSLKGHLKAIRRKRRQLNKVNLPGVSTPPDLQLHRYPGVSLEEVRTRVSRFLQVLSASSDLEVEQIGNHIYRIST